jgi:hypothetical protein
MGLDGSMSMDGRPSSSRCDDLNTIKRRPGQAGPPISRHRGLDPANFHGMMFEPYRGGKDRGGPRRPHFAGGAEGVLRQRFFKFNRC